MRIIILIASCALLWFGFTGLKEGSVYVKGSSFVKRDESPFNYWFNVGTYIVAGITGITFSLFFF